MSTNYTGNPTAVQAPSPQPSPGAIPIVVLAADGDWFGAGAFKQPFKTLADFVAFVMGTNLYGNFGDGSDGNATANGTTAIAGATLSGGVYTLTRDVFYNNLTVSAGATIKVAGWRIYCRGILTTTGGGTISGDGASGVPAGHAGGINIIGGGGSSSSVAVGASGGAASGTAAGSPGGAAAAGYGGAGGAGGAGNAFSGGAGGAAGGTVSMSPHAYSPVGLGQGLLASYGGGGGGGAGGAGSGSVFSGCGGAGGNVVAVAARNIVLATSMDITARGGNGQFQSSSSGGGGGGGGGTIILPNYSIDIVSGAMSGAANCPGGTAPTGNFVNGVAGSAGNLFLVQV